jgi:hypothetical protein
MIIGPSDALRLHNNYWSTSFDVRQTWARALHMSAFRVKRTCLVRCKCLLLIQNLFANGGSS